MNGAVVWFTGLPSSGKSNLASRVNARLTAERIPCCTLDGDTVRALLQPPPGYSSEERDAFYRTLADLALELSRQGLVVLVPATAHRRIHRARARESAPRFIEVWMTAPLNECRERDAKGLYARFAAGQLHGIPGEDVSYEFPEHPDVTSHGGQDDAALSLILQLLAS